MAQTFMSSDGSPQGCFPAADVIGTTLTFTAGSAPNTVASVTVFFNIHTDGGGSQRDGFIKITCKDGGPTSNFVYTTVGDTGHSSQYEIDTTADCSKSGISPSPPPPSNSFACLNGTCVDAPGSGVPKDVCDRICLKPDAKYVCDHDKCVPSPDPSRGVDEATCEAICQ